MQKYDVVVIGGGFYGCSVAIFLKKYFKDIVILEKEKDIFLKASSINQARIHGGYHYPRSILTAYSSKKNLDKYIVDYKDSVVDKYQNIYGIAKNSKVTNDQFYSFFSKIGAPLYNVDANIKKIFNREMVPNLYKVKELVFDYSKLKKQISADLTKNKIELRTSSDVAKLSQHNSNQIKVTLQNNEEINAEHVFICTYAGINEILHDSKLPLMPLKFQMTEMCLVEVPNELSNICITVMDGPYFSLMPFPAENTFILSHVRYTPHYNWDDPNFRPNVKSYSKSNYVYMYKDAQRFVPIMEKLKFVRSLYEIKALLKTSDRDDGRPIAYRKNHGLKNLNIVLGGKIDNIYDILDNLKEDFDKDFKN